MKRNTELVTSRDWCINQYETQYKSLHQIRSQTGLGINTIKRWFKKHGIKTRQDDVIVRSQKSHKLRNNPNWKGRYNNCGYYYIYHPNHPNAPPSGYISEHRFIAEQLVDRVLNIDEFVHHIDMDKTNNSLDNLFITKQRGHKNLQYSFNRLCKSLLGAGLIYFDKESGNYGLRERLHFNVCEGRRDTKRSQIWRIGFYCIT